MDDLKTEKTDQMLVRDALAKADAFSAIVYRYQAALKRYCIRIGCKSGDDVEDILQNIFIKVYLNLNDYDERLKFSSWIYRIAHNETIDFFRKKSVRPMPVSTEEELKLFEELVDEDHFLESLNNKMNATILRGAVDELEREYRDVLVLRFLEDKNYTEISDILKIPLGTVDQEPLVY